MSSSWSSRELVEWVVGSGKRLTTIYIEHSHGDDFLSEVPAGHLSPRKSGRPPGCLQVRNTRYVPNPALAAVLFSDAFLRLAGRVRSWSWMMERL